MSDDTSGGPIAGSTATLLTWLAGSGVPAQVSAPDDRFTGGARLSAWPYALLPEQEVRGTGEPLRLRVRYLLSVDGPARDSVRLLDAVLANAAREPGLRVLFDPPAPEVWTGLGVAPRLAFVVDVPARVERTVPVIPRVRAGLRLDATALRPLYGKAIGPGGVPLAGLRVEAEGTGYATQTDPGGHFYFAGLPAGQPVRLALSGRGLQFHVEAPADSPEPVVVQCDTEEV